MSDRPIHLRKFEHICTPRPNTDDSVVVPVWLTQSNLDGLYTLIQFFNGLGAAGQGRVDGTFELTMFYRQLQSAISEANNKAKPTLESPGVSVTGD